MIFWPRRSGPCKRRGPVYTLECIYMVYIHTHTQGTPSGCTCGEIPGVTQVVIEGNTAAVTSYLRWRKHGKKKAGQELTYWLLWFTLNIISYSHSCGSQVKAQPSSGHIFHASSCVRRDYPSEVMMEIIYYCTINKSGRMSRKLASGKYLYITK